MNDPRPKRQRLPRADELGLRRGLPDRLLPFLVGAMAFLAALALAGLVVATALAAHWQAGAAAALTVLVPDPATDARLSRVLDALHATPGIAEARALSEAELQTLLRPWLGPGPAALPLPAVIAVRLAAPVPGLAERLASVAAGTIVEAQDIWVGRLSSLARSLQACAALAMGVVALVAVAVVVVATWAGLSTRRDAIIVVHGLGATDGFIAGRFAGRATRLAAGGAASGAILALPVLLGLAGLAAPFAGRDAPEGTALLTALPVPLWLGLPALPMIAAAIGWLTAQATVRRWLRSLP